MAYIIKEFEVDKTKSFMENLLSCLDKQFITNIQNSTLEETSFSQLHLSIVEKLINTSEKQKRGNTLLKLESGLDRITGDVTVGYQKMNLFRYGYLTDDEMLHLGFFKYNVRTTWKDSLPEELKTLFIEDLRQKLSLGTTGKIRFSDETMNGDELLVITDFFREGDHVIFQGNILENDFWVADEKYDSDTEYKYIKKFKAEIIAPISLLYLDDLYVDAEGFVVGGDLVSLEDEAGGFLASDKDLYQMKDAHGYIVSEKDLAVVLTEDTLPGFNVQTKTSPTLEKLNLIDTAHGLIQTPKGTD